MPGFAMRPLARFAVWAEPPLSAELDECGKFTRIHLGNHLSLLFMMNKLFVVLLCKSITGKNGVIFVCVDNLSRISVCNINIRKRNLNSIHMISNLLII